MMKLAHDTFHRFLASLTGRSRAVLFAAIFCLFATFGFLTDIMSGGRHSAPHIMFDVGFSGVMAALFAFVTASSPRMLWPLLLAQVSAGTLIAATAPRIFGDGPQLTGEALRLRLTLDSAGCMVAVVCGYLAVAAFLGREGAGYLRMRAEMRLAQEVHVGLVPALAGRTERAEFVGASHPSGEVGGDLVDVFTVPDGNRWIAYVSDVSGHGVHAGVVMGMVKSAARMALTRHATLDELFRDLNEVLLPLKSSSMFVTAAAIEASADGWRVSVAGHVPILHVRCETGTVDEVTTANVALGLVANQTYTTKQLHCRSGDVLGLVTDGFIEVFDAADRELGLDAIKLVFAQACNESPLNMFAALRRAAAAHGVQLDDQSALIVRVIAV